MSEEKDEVIGPERKERFLQARVMDQPDNPPPEQKKKTEEQKE